MLKKIHGSKSLNYMNNKECDVKCLVCKNYSSTILYVCESGHFVCKTCRSVELGRGIQGKSRNIVHCLHKQRNTSLNISDNIDKNKERDLASGDNEKIQQNYKTLKQEKNAQKTDDNFQLKPMNTDCNDTLDATIIEYKNDNFKDSFSSVDSISVNIVNCKNKVNYKELEDNRSRPIKCPVTTCGKIIAIDSTMQHFYFDHSKIAKTTLQPRKSQRIILKSCTFTKETQCIGILVHNNVPGISGQQRHTVDTFASNDENRLFLMCAIKEFNCTTNPNKLNISSAQNHSEILLGKSIKFKHNTILLLWLCKTGNNNHSYKVTLSRDDKLLSYSFTGEPINIRDSQDAESIYEKSNCLMVREAAANRLLDNHKQFHIFISIVQLN